MSATALAERLNRDRETVLWAAIVLNAELGVTLGYLALAPVGEVEPVYLAVPFVWLNVAAWAVWRVDAPAASRNARLAAGGVAVVYFAVLGWVGGVFGTTHHAHGLLAVPHVSIHWVLPPGWGPLLDVSWAGFQAMLFPYRVLGYAALAYLVYATVLDAATRAVGGVVGLFACVSCAWPVLGSVAASVLGSGSALAVVATNQPYRASTVVFVTAVALLVWRPRGD